MFVRRAFVGERDRELRVPTRGRTEAHEEMLEVARVGRKPFGNEFEPVGPLVIGRAVHRLANERKGVQPDREVDGGAVGLERRVARFDLREQRLEPGRLDGGRRGRLRRGGRRAKDEHGEHGGDEDGAHHAGTIAHHGAGTPASGGERPRRFFQRG